MTQVDHDRRTDARVAGQQVTTSMDWRKTDALLRAGWTFATACGGTVWLQRRAPHDQDAGMIDTTKDGRTRR